MTRLLLLAAALAAASLPAPAQGERPVDVAARAGILLLGNGAEPATLDPHLATGVTENKIISTLIEGLVAYHPSDSNLVEPGMAERWEPNADASVWTFHLREARWSNGDPVRASDFVYAARRILTAELGGQYANMLYILDGAEGYHRQDDPEFTGERIRDFARVGVSAPDERTVVYRLRGPAPYFANMLTHYSWFPVHPPTIEAHGGLTARQSPWIRPGNFVGNGAFRLEEWSTNKLVRVVRSPTYWDAANVGPREVHFLPIDNQNTEEQMFLNGQLHVTNTLPVDRIAYHRTNNPQVLRLEPYLGTYFYRFNVTRAPLNDVRVRRALTLAVDSEAIVERITQGGQQPAVGFIPDGFLGYEAVESVFFDPDEARRLLAEAGYPNGAGFPRISILYNTQEAHRRIAEAIQQMWKRELNVDIGLLNQEWKVYLDSQRTMDYDISRSGWIGDYMDPITMLKLWVTGDGNNNTGWGNPAYDAALRESAITADPAARFALLRRAEEILLEELPVLPIYWYTRVYLVSPHVVGWNPTLLDNRPYKRLTLRAE